MLKLLNNSRTPELSTLSSNRASSNGDFTRKSGDFNGVNFSDKRPSIQTSGWWRGGGGKEEEQDNNEHYEQLWELSTTVNEYDNVPEVGEEEDILDGEDDGLVEGCVDDWEENLYENTSVTTANLTLRFHTHTIILIISGHFFFRTFV